MSPARRAHPATVTPEVKRLHSYSQLYGPGWVKLIGGNHPEPGQVAALLEEAALAHPISDVDHLRECDPCRKRYAWLGERGRAPRTGTGAEQRASAEILIDLRAPESTPERPPAPDATDDTSKPRGASGERAARPARLCRRCLRPKAEDDDDLSGVCVDCREAALMVWRETGKLPPRERI